MSFNPFSLVNKTILVTGASSGIGRGIAIECSKMGGTVIITGRDVERLDETYASLYGVGHLKYVFDLDSSENLDALVNNVTKLDGLVCNAGINRMSVVQFIKEKDIVDIYRTNTISPILLTQKLLRKKKMKNPSSIVFISSSSGVNTYGLGNSMYGSSKAAIYAFSRHAANELGSKGIRCNSVHPGLVFTNMMEATKEVTEEGLAKNLELYPLKRHGKPEDIAHGVIYLLSDASSWVTGEDLIIDGGVSLRK